VSFAREGYPFIAAGLLLAAASWGGSLAGIGSLVLQVVAVGFSLLALFTVWFFRDPNRPQPSEAGVVVAPGEGRVIGVSEVEEESFLGERARKISIFLSVFDVHVQRSPVAGVIEHRSYRAGAYAVAWADKASEDNEQASLGIRSDHGKVLVRQIAGLVARRIVTYPSEGDRVERGERIGLIRFGSRVDLFLPLSWKVTCSVGDRVRVGSTVLARHPVEANA
jgi:phosphatidylserine decarboxylase